MTAIGAITQSRTASGKRFMALLEREAFEPILPDRERRLPGAASRARSGQYAPSQQAHVMPPATNEEANRRTKGLFTWLYICGSSLRPSDEHSPGPRALEHLDVGEPSAVQAAGRRGSSRGRRAAGLGPTAC